MYKSFSEISIGTMFTFFIYGRGIVAFIKVDYNFAKDEDGELTKFIANDIVNVL